MNLVKAVEVSKKFSTFHPKVFKGFFEWGICYTKTDGYIVLTDSSLGKEPNFGKLKEYVKNHNLRVNRVKGYLMVFAPF